MSQPAQPNYALTYEMPKKKSNTKHGPKTARLKRWFVGAAALVAFAGLTVALIFYAETQTLEARWQRANQERADARRTSKAEQETLDAWRPIQGQLVQYSKRSFPVIVGQTGQWGRAAPGGHIVIDLTTLRDPKDILAFKLAHEWAHLVLHHTSPHATRGEPGLSLNTTPARPRPSVPTPGVSHNPTATRIEDEADAWAGQFLVKYNYDLDAVAAFLKNVPYNPTDTTHSPGPTRANLVLAAKANQ